ncbi:MAG: serine--tRNA ligase [Thermoplasmatales archaeon]
MIDVNILRKNPEVLYESQKKRFQDTKIIDEAVALDSEWRNLLKKTNDLKAKKNSLVRKISEIIRKGEDVEPIKEEAERIDAEIKDLEKKLKDVEENRDRTLRMIPNIVDPEAPVAEDESGNVPVYFSGKAKVFSGDLDNFRKQSLGKMEFYVIDRRPQSHVDLLQNRNLINLETAAMVAGSRFYYLLGDLVLLENALELFALKFLVERGFTPLEPPFMLNRDAMSGATDFTAFEDTLYKIDGDDLYLISTAEHPIAAFLKDRIVDEDDLPMLFAGISPCFRREAGAHGKDTKGIFRVHQFNKIEQFAFVKPEDSKSYHRKLLENAMEFYNLLEIPYRVVDIATGDLGNLASRKFDIEAWYPAQGLFREVVSASNDLDYQARRLMIRMRTKEGNTYLHTINSTLTATTRTLVAIVENYQTDEGKIVVPKVLREFIGKEVL